MTKISPMNIKRICYTCGSNKLSSKAGKVEKYCVKCGTVAEYSFLD